MRVPEPVKRHSTGAATAASHTPTPPAGHVPKEAGELYGLVFATVPAILAYFIGWAYLYYYLAQFGIGLSELELGLETIFIYSAPPLVWMFKSFWPGLLVIAIATAVIYMARTRIPTGVRALVVTASRSMARTSVITQGLIAFALLVPTVLILSPLIRRAAIERATEKWTHSGVTIQAAVKKPGDSWSGYDDYQKCAERRALDLILADHDAYFMLCISELDEDAGMVYEVKREDSVLTSARNVKRTLPEQGESK